MSSVPSRDLRSSTRELLERVGSGEVITITINGRPVATLQSVGHRPDSWSRDEFISRVLPRQADPGLRRELAEMLSDTPGDVPIG